MEVGFLAIVNISVSIFFVLFFLLRKSPVWSGDGMEVGFLSIVNISVPMFFFGCGLFSLKSHLFGVVIVWR